MLLAAGRVPTDPRAWPLAAAELPLAALNRRLAGTLPRVLLPAAGEERGTAVAASLSVTDVEGHVHRCPRGAIALLQRDTEPDIIRYERRVDYRQRGTLMEPSGKANLERLWTWLCHMVPPGAVDERVAQPGFVSSLPATAADPVDLTLFLVALARR